MEPKRGGETDTVELLIFKNYIYRTPNTKNTEPFRKECDSSISIKRHNRRYHTLSVS